MELLQFFKFDHLPEHLQVVSKPFYTLANRLDDLPNNPERAMAIRKLLEARDCAIRCMLFEGRPNVMD